MNRLASFLLISAVLIGGAARAADEPAAAAPVTAINAKDNLAVHGYDPVSYFTENKPEAGSAKYDYEWQGAHWRFVSAEHLDTFKKEPERYAPQFGGYCALAVSLGRTADGDPAQWAIVDGKLFLNNNPKAKALWDQDRPGRIVAADKQWPSIAKTPNQGE